MMNLHLHPVNLRMSAEECHAVMEDRALYSVNQVESAIRVYLLYYVPAVVLPNLPGILDASAEIEERPDIFNLALKDQLK